MSHHAPTFSVPGTPLSERTVGELVAERPGRSRIFEDYRIDFCCQGGRTLRDACERRGAPLETVIARLEDEAAAKEAAPFNPATLRPAALVAHVVETHHAWLRRELPRLGTMADRVASVHGERRPSLVEVRDVLAGLSGELESHMAKEEEILFPAIEAMDRGAGAPWPLDGPIACMLHEHDEAGEALERLHKLTDGYRPPAEACNTWRALFAGLADLEEDLHRHIHLENAVLFPAAERLARGEPVGAGGR